LAVIYTPDYDDWLLLAGVKLQKVATAVSGTNPHKCLKLPTFSQPGCNIKTLVSRFPFLFPLPPLLLLNMLSVAARSRTAISVASSRSFLSTWSSVPQGKEHCLF
jgi:hypothetical protein